MSEIGFNPIPMGGSQRIKPSKAPPRKEKSDSPPTEVFRTPSSSEPGFHASVPGLEGLKNVRLHFKIDPETHEISVAVIDQNTDKIIRTIPPEQVREMSSGSLIEVLT